MLKPEEELRALIQKALEESRTQREKGEVPELKKYTFMQNLDPLH